MAHHRTHGFTKWVKSIPLSVWLFMTLFVLTAGAIGALSWYGYDSFMRLSTRTNSLETQLASTTELLMTNIEQTNTTLADALEQERQKAVALEARLGTFQQEVGSISGTVTTLEKLSKTDPELLQKYSRVFFLNEHYAPERTVELPDLYEYDEERHLQVHTQTWPYLKSMLDKAKQDGMELYVYSAYRPFEEQQALKGQYVVTYGAGTANQFSADQGYSEHQLGTSVDLITTGIGGTLEGFENTTAYQWLVQNAHRWGYVLSYPEGNTHYVFEPWHWRFVGIKLATDLRSSGKNFYDLDQREIDAYLVSIFE